MSDNNETQEAIPRFEEVNRMYTTREAIDEAKRCLHCKVPQCRKGCPIDNNIPEFIHELSKGNMGEAMSVLHEKTNLPAICGRVCRTRSNAKAIACWARKAALSVWENWKASLPSLMPICI